MSIELMPLIEKRAITITAAALGDGRIRVNVGPMALAGDTKVNDKVDHANKDKIAQVPESAIHALTARGRTTENARAVTRCAALERGCHQQGSRAIGLPGEETARHPA
jgi:hypothetical protein